MAANSDHDLGSVLSNFDQIYEDFRNGIAEIQLLKSNCNAETKKREALEISCSSLKQENERLRKLYTESLNKLADQLEGRNRCQSLREELKRVHGEYLSKETENRKAMELLEQECAIKSRDLEAQLRGLALEKTTCEATINHLRQELAAHKTQLQALAERFEQVCLYKESNYNLEIQDLKDCLMVEQEEKKELNKRLWDLEKELLISKTNLVEQQRVLTSSSNTETLKLKIMKLRKENEILKRKLSQSEEGRGPQ